MEHNSIRRIRRGKRMQPTTPSRWILAPAIAASLGSVNMPVSAQDLVIEEVLVTAQKRVESAQDIPVALTVISGDMIDNIGIQSTTDLVKIAPSLTVREANHAQNSAFSIRGIGTITFGIGVEQSVAVLVDEVAAVQSGQTMAGLMDIERVEVLRGPQNTLFGKSASAGLLSITTKAPSEELESYLILTATDDDETRVAASISGPLSDSVGYRLSGNWSDRDGYIRNLTAGEKDKNGSKNKNVRGKLRWDVNESIQADFTAYYMKDETNCCARVWTEFDPDAKLFGFIPESVAEGITPGEDNQDFRADDGPQNDSTTKGANVRLNLDLGEFTLTSITAVDNWEFNVNQDVDFGDIDVLKYLTGGRESGGLYSVGWFETDFFSQEIRIASPAYDSYDYVVGLYYSDAETKRTFFRNLSLAPADFASSAGNENLGLFGQLTWRFTDSTSITGGLRWIKEEISADYENFANAEDTPFSDTASDEQVVGKLSLQHFIGEDTMAFASYTRGYKGQVFDLDVGVRNLIDPETSDSYEIGVKGNLWERRLQLNLVAFYTTYEGFQVQRAEIVDEVIKFELNNVGELNTRGVELESIALLSQNATLTFNAAYIDAVVNDYDGASCYTGQTEEQGCVNQAQTIDGGSLPYAPEWKYTAVLDYRLPLDTMPFDAFANVLYSWQDDTLLSINQNPNLTQDSYGVVNLRLGINDKSSRYSVTLFANNLLDEGYATSKLDVSRLFGNATARAQITPRSTQRYFGVEARFNF
ncbi:hypothetical protein C0039_17955 [Pseudohalioglobus lutimaris]|uniref:TonB-dependent receptor n=2 Tax=Pseudohalioglobus lutimaris TaxID=1737061 RepID=A0A2N5WYA3_9GAMM|nr:hypothetical protein C0039_17955 [Pseudohalioglobus lutimaris]